MKNILPAITLYQPWATWIMREWKLIETRTHSRFACLKNQTILIHAGKTTDGSEFATKNPYLSFEQIILNPDEVINGCLLGTAYVDDFKLLNDQYSKEALIDCGTVKRYGLFLKNIVKFEKAIPVKGEVGIWYYDMKRKIKVKKPTAQIQMF